MRVEALLRMTGPRKGKQTSTTLLMQYRYAAPRLHNFSSLLDKYKPTRFHHSLFHALVPGSSLSAAQIGDLRVPWKLQLPATLHSCTALDVGGMTGTGGTRRGNPSPSAAHGCTDSDWTNSTPHSQSWGLSDSISHRSVR
jgi:hypothetical protein